MSQSCLRPYSPANPPVKASRNAAPSTTPCMAVHSSLSVSDILYFLLPFGTLGLVELPPLALAVSSGRFFPQNTLPFFVLLGIYLAPSEALP